MSNRRKPRRAHPVAQIQRYNGYKCEECGGAWLTVDLAQGVTPIFSPCFRTEGCQGRAVSMGYPPGPPPAALPLLIEWYQPTNLRGLSPELRDHVQRGGLLRRAANEAPQWVKEMA